MSTKVECMCGEGCGYSVEIGVDRWEGEDVVYFAASDESGRRGTMTIPVGIMVWFVSHRDFCLVEYGDFDDRVAIDKLEGEISITTSACGDFQMKIFSDHFIAAIEKEMNGGDSN